MKHNRKPQFTPTDYAWLINLVQKDIATTEKILDKLPHPLHKQRLELMQSLHKDLEGMMEYERLAQQRRARAGR